MAAKQFWDQGQPNELIPSFEYTGDLRYWDRGLPMPALQSTAINIVGTSIVGGATVFSGGAVTIPTIPIVGTGIVGGASVPSGGVVGNATLPIIGTSIVGGASVPSGGTVTVTAPPSPPSPGSPSWSGYGQTKLPLRKRNEYDVWLEGEYANMMRAMRGVVTSWGLAGLGDINKSGGVPGCVRSEPDLVMGQMGDLKLRSELRRNYFERGSILTPTTVSGENVLVSFQVPVGYFGLILGVYNIYTGTGFVDGSGDIVWRLKVGGRWLRNWGNQLYSQGSVSNPFPIMASDTAVSGERIVMTVTVPNLSGNIQIGASRILGAVQGWFYPMPARWAGALSRRT